MSSTPPIPRTTPDQVQSIVSVEAGVDLTTFIAMANNLTTNVCGNSGYTDGFIGSQMEQIETLLAAHFYTMFDQQIAHAKAGTVAVMYQYKINYDLRSSVYGQQAIMLDYLGNLSELVNTAAVRKKVMVWVKSCGREPDYPGGFGADLTVET
jgi:hypothetical protein